jgi:hypothetical protein
MRYSEIINEAPKAPEFTSTQYSKMSDLRAAITKVWGDIPQYDRVQITRTGSNRGVTFGRSHLLDPKTKKVVGYWETTGADLYPGRGLVTTGYGAVAVKASRSKTVEPKVAKTPVATGKATPQELASALQAMLMAMKAKDGRADYTAMDAVSFDTRYWGQWEVPAGEEDDGDYDWKELSDQSSKDLLAIKTKVCSQFPNVAIDFEDSEKEHITIHVKSRK